MTLDLQMRSQEHKCQVKADRLMRKCCTASFYVNKKREGTELKASKNKSCTGYRNAEFNNKWRFQHSYLSPSFWGKIADRLPKFSIAHQLFLSISFQKVSWGRTIWRGLV